MPFFELAKWELKIEPTLTELLWENQMQKAYTEIALTLPWARNSPAHQGKSWDRTGLLVSLAPELTSIVVLGDRSHSLGSSTLCYKAGVILSISGSNEIIKFIKIYKTDSV